MSTTTRPRVFVCARVSPKSEGCAHIDRRVLEKYADDAMRHAIDQGAAPFPWIGYGAILDDDAPAERTAALDCCLSWLPFAEELWVFADFGVSSGMRGEIAKAETLGVPVKTLHLFPL